MFQTARCSSSICSWTTSLHSATMVRVTLASICLVLLNLILVQAAFDPATLRCHDPAQGSTTVARNKKFLLIAGAGAGMGNFLIFFPAAYYFAALTGREILIQDDSVVGEMCQVLQCGFPLYNDMAAAFPSVVNKDLLNNVRGVKVMDFHELFSGHTTISDKLVRADGYKELSGWYVDYPHADECIAMITGCSARDVSCHDRHALQQLIRGPFKTAFSEEEEKKIIGVPTNFKHGIMTLPHVYAPRLDAAVHLRCQFKHFEWLVGKEDTMWKEYVKEVDEWLYSSDINKGQQLFKEVEQKIMSQLHNILAERKVAERRRRLLSTQYLTQYAKVLQTLGSPSNSSQFAPSGPRLVQTIRRLVESGEVNGTQLELDIQHEHEVYHGTDDRNDRVYVYLASDNERVKEAFAKYLLGHHNISVMRVHTRDSIVHVKNTGYLKQTSDGLMALVVDWYSLSLANVLFAWRRDTGITSTFVKSAQKVSGNGDSIDKKLHAASNTDAPAAVAEDSAREPAYHAKMFQLTYGRNNNPVWGEQ